MEAERVVRPYPAFRTPMRKMADMAKIQILDTPGAQSQ
jgi:hypothetical protein